MESVKDVQAAYSVCQSRHAIRPPQTNHSDDTVSFLGSRGFQADCGFQGFGTGSRNQGGHEEQAGTV